MERSLEKSLYDAATRGDAKSLHELLEEDPLLLDRVSFTCANKTPLHVATMKDQLAFVQEILNLNPNLAQELDSQQSSPLHIASNEGYLDIVKKLLLVAPHMCMSHDCQGRNPLHLAAMKGHVEILKLLIQNAPFAAREKVDRDQSVLHLCVKHGQLEALKVLVPVLNESINSKDDNGDTILHMAVWNKNIQIIQYLVEKTKINVNAENSGGQTAMHILKQNQTDEERDLQIKNILKLRYSYYNYTQRQRVKWLTKKGDAIMMMSVLIATMAFQAGLSPAGGIWQGDLTHANPQRAGEAVMAYYHPKAYKNFIRSNTIAFIASISIILLLISGLPFRRRVFMWILMIIMWLTVTSLSMSYAISIVVLSPNNEGKSLVHILKIVLVVWFGVMGIFIVGNVGKRFERWLKDKRITQWWPRRCRNVAQVKDATQEIV